MRNSLKIAGALLLGGAVAACGDDGGGNTPDPIVIATSDVSLSVSGVELLENSGTQTITVTFDVPADTAGTINVDLSGTATYGDDYTTSPEAVSGVVALSFASGEESKTVTITPVNDDTAESDETIIISASSDNSFFDVAGISSLTVDLIDVDATVFAAMRRSGGIFSIDPTSGERAFVRSVLNDMEPLTNLTGLAYDFANDQAYVALGGNGQFPVAGNLYQLDILTGETTILNENDASSSADINGFGGYGHLSYQGDKLLAFLGNVQTVGVGIEVAIARGGNLKALVEFDETNGNIVDFIQTASTSGQGAFATQDADSVFITSSSRNAFSLNVADGEQSITKTASTNDEASFTADFANFSINSMSMQALTYGQDGVLYGILSAFDGGRFRANGGASAAYQFLVTIDPATYEVSHVALVGTDSDEDFWVLAEVPAYLVR